MYTLKVLSNDCLKKNLQTCDINEKNIKILFHSFFSHFAQTSSHFVRYFYLQEENLPDFNTIPRV